jgi:hypothetical protein
MPRRPAGHWFYEERRGDLHGFCALGRLRKFCLECDAVVGHEIPIPAGITVSPTVIADHVAKV